MCVLHLVLVLKPTLRKKKRACGCTRVPALTCVRTCVCTCMLRCTHACMSVCLRTHVCMSACLCACLHRCLRMYVRAGMRTCVRTLPAFVRCLCACTHAYEGWRATLAQVSCTLFRVYHLLLWSRVSHWSEACRLG